MFFSRKPARIEPSFRDTPTAAQRQAIRGLTFDIQPDNSVLFVRDGRSVQYIPAVTNRGTTDQLVLAGLRELSKTDPDVHPTVIDRTGRWTHYLREGPYSRRTINNVPQHYIVD